MTLLTTKFGRARCFAAFVALLLTAAAHGAPQVIHDAGGVPITHLITGEDSDQGAQSVPSPDPEQTIALFPVATRNARAGTLSPNPRHTELPGGPGRAIALVGDDPASQHWLRANAERLATLDAAVMVVNVDSQAQFIALKTLASVPFVPASGEALFEALGVDVWPLLILADGQITQ